MGGQRSSSIAARRFASSAGLSIPDPDVTLRALEMVRDEALRPFDLTRGPMMRAALLQLAKDDHVLMLTLHHIVSDGWSMGVLIHELATLYNAFRAEPSPLPPVRGPVCGLRQLAA